MKKFELSEELIKDIHGKLSSGGYLKEQIEKEVPDLFGVELEVGKWYVSETESLSNYNGETWNYGIGWGEKWFDKQSWIASDISSGKLNRWRLATPEEVQSALEKEAVKRGLVEGANVIPVGYKQKFTLSGINPQGSKGIYYFDGYALWANVNETLNVVIFQKGKWAAIIEHPKEYTIEQLTELVGHEFKIVKK